MTTDLPAGWYIRHPNLDDVDEILAVVQASDVAAVGEPDFTAEEVVEILTAPNHDPSRDSWLALDPSGRVAGWAYLHNPSRSGRDNLDVYVHPEDGRAAQRHLLHLALDRIAGRAAEFGYPALTVRSGAVPSETGLIAMLRRAGFKFIKRYARMRRDLVDGEPMPRHPAGVTVRTIRPDDEADVRTFHRIIAEAFDDLPDPFPFDYPGYRDYLGAQPGICWDEWFVAEVAGVPAGVLQSAGRPEDKGEGWVRYLAVTKEFRHQGLGRLLLRTAFATYAGKGRASAGLGVDLTNPTGAYRLYQGVGMRPAYEVDIFERTVLAGGPASDTGRSPAP